MYFLLNTDFVCNCKGLCYKYQQLDGFGQVNEHEWIQLLAMCFMLLLSPNIISSFCVKSRTCVYFNFCYQNKQFDKYCVINSSCIL